MLGVNKREINSRGYEFRDSGPAATRPDINLINPRTLCLSLRSRRGRRITGDSVRGISVLLRHVVTLGGEYRLTTRDPKPARTMRPRVLPCANVDVDPLRERAGDKLN